MHKKLILSCILLQVYTADVFAAGGDLHHESKSGLPQLDPSSYPSQIFWLIIVFVFMYIFFVQKSLPDISKVIETRSERINNDLNSAEKLKEEVETVQRNYEESLSEANNQAQMIFKKSEDDLKQKSEKNAKDFQERSAKQISS